MNFCLLFMRVLGEQNIAIPFLILSSVVFSFRLGTEFYERKVQQILNMSIDKIETSEQLEQYVRANLMKKEDLNLEKYYSSKLGIIFEGLKVEHKVDCTKKSCFCRRYELMEQHKKQDCKEKKRFLIKFLDKVFEKHLKKRKKDKNFDKNFLIIYCSFIIEILRCPIKSYVYLLQLEQDKDLQTLEQRVLSFLLQRKAQTQFEQYFKFDEDYTFESGLQFCEQMEQFKDNYKKFLLNQRQFYVSIGQEHIDLNKFYIFCFNQINERNNIEKEIQSLFFVNRKSQKLQQYAFIYANVFDLKRQKFKKNLSKIYKKIYLKQIKTVQKSYSLFHKDTGTVFVSLLQPIGKIQRASRNFLKIFGYSLKDLQDQSINLIMPPAVARSHDKILQFYVSRGVEHPSEVKDMQKMLLGKRKNQCLVPINIYFQLSLLGTEEFGLNALVQVITNNSEYIFLDKPSSQKRNNSSAGTIDSNQNLFSNEPKCVFNSNYQNPNESKMDDKQNQDNKSNNSNNTQTDLKTFKSLGFQISNITPQAYFDLFLRIGIDYEKIKGLNMRKMIPIMFLDLEVGRQYKSFIVIPSNEIVIKNFQIKNDSYLPKNKQILQLFKFLDESQDNDYDLYEISFCIQMQVASNGIEVYYLEIFEYNNIERIYDKYHLINEVKQIICSIVKLKLPKSTKYAIFSKTKDKVSNILEKMKEKKTLKSNKYNDPYSTQFVPNKIPTSESTSEIEDESQVNKDQDIRKTLENESEILRNLIGSNDYYNNQTSELSEIQTKSKDIHSIFLSPIKAETSKGQDSILGDSSYNQYTESQNTRNNTYKSENNKNKVGIVIINPTFHETDKAEIQEKRTNSLINNNLLSADFQYEDDLSSYASEDKRSFSNFDRINSNGTMLSKLSGYNKQMTVSQRASNKNHRDLIKRKAIQQKFFKSSPRNVTKAGGVLLQTTGYNYMNNFSSNLYGTVNQNQQLEEIKLQNSTIKKKLSFNSDRDSKMSKYHRKYEKVEDENSEDLEQNEEARNLQILQKKQKRALELNLDDSQDNLNMSVDISEMLNENIQTQINDRASASSFKNEFNALKRKIINYIFDISQHGLISSILIFGLISYLFFFGMTLFTFIIVKQSSSNQIDSIDQLSKFISLKFNSKNQIQI